MLGREEKQEFRASEKPEVGSREGELSFKIKEGRKLSENYGEEIFNTLKFKQVNFINSAKFPS